MQAETPQQQLSKLFIIYQRIVNFFEKKQRENEIHSNQLISTLNDITTMLELMRNNGMPQQTIFDKIKITARYVRDFVNQCLSNEFGEACCTKIPITAKERTYLDRLVDQYGKMVDVEGGANPFDPEYPYDDDDDDDGGSPPSKRQRTQDHGKRHHRLRQLIQATKKEFRYAVDLINAVRDALKKKGGSYDDYYLDALQYNVKTALESLSDPMFNMNDWRNVDDSFEQLEHFLLRDINDFFDGDYTMFERRAYRPDMLDSQVWVRLSKLHKEWKAYQEKGAFDMDYNPQAFEKYRGVANPFDPLDDGDDDGSPPAKRPRIPDQGKKKDHKKLRLIIRQTKEVFERAIAFLQRLISVRQSQGKPYDAFLDVLQYNIQTALQSLSDPMFNKRDYEKVDGALTQILDFMHHGIDEYFYDIPKSFPNAHTFDPAIKDDQLINEIEQLVDKWDDYDSKGAFDMDWQPWYFEKYHS